MGFKWVLALSTEEVPDPGFWRTEILRTDTLTPKHMGLGLDFLTEDHVLLTLLSSDGLLSYSSTFLIQPFVFDFSSRTSKGSSLPESTKTSRFTLAVNRNSCAIPPLSAPNLFSQSLPPFPNSNGSSPGIIHQPIRHRYNQSRHRSSSSLINQQARYLGYQQRYCQQSCEQKLQLVR